MPTNTSPGRSRLAAALDGDSPGNWADAMDADALDTARPEARELIRWAPLDLLLAYREIDELIAACELALAAFEANHDDDEYGFDAEIEALRSALLKAKE